MVNLAALVYNSIKIPGKHSQRPALLLPYHSQQSMKHPFESKPRQNRDPFQWICDKQRSKTNLLAYAGLYITGATRISECVLQSHSRMPNPSLTARSCSSIVAKIRPMLKYIFALSAIFYSLSVSTAVIRSCHQRVRRRLVVHHSSLDCRMPRKHAAIALIQAMDWSE